LSCSGGVAPGDPRGRQRQSTPGLDAHFHRRPRTSNHVYIRLSHRAFDAVSRSSPSSRFLLQARRPNLAIDITALAARESFTTSSQQQLALVAPPGADRSSAKSQRASFFCAFPRLPVKRPDDNTPARSYSPAPYSSGNSYYRYSHRRTSTFPASGSDVPRKPVPLVFRLPVQVSSSSSSTSSAAQPVSFPSRPRANTAPPGAEQQQERTLRPTQPLLSSSPPQEPGRQSPPRGHKRTGSRTVFTSASKARPLRLVQDALNRKRRPPVFFAQSNRSLLQSVTYITIHQQLEHLTQELQDTLDKMANPNPILPKVVPLSSLPSNPRPPVPMPAQVDKEKIIADLRRQVMTFRLP